MPLEPAGEFLYFLMVALLYGAPLIVLILWSAWRKGRLRAGLAAVALLLPAAAAAGMLLLRGSLWIASRGYDGERGEIHAYLRDPERARVVHGAFVGSARRSSQEYRRYQFPSLDGSELYVLEVELPPDTGGALAEIRLTRERAPAQAAARLVVWPERIGDNPAMAPEEFFRDHLPAEQPDAFGAHTLIVGLRPRQSIVVHPREAGGGASDWRWTNASLDLDPR